MPQHTEPLPDWELVLSSAARLQHKRGWRGQSWVPTGASLPWRHSRVTGTYATSNDRVDLMDDSSNRLKDQDMGYSFGIDRDGEYLSIATVLTINADSNDEPKKGPQTQFWRSQ